MPGDDFPPPVDPPSPVVSAYGITEADLVKRITVKLLAQLTDDTAGASADLAVIAEAITAAEAELHSYASVYYVVPIAEDSPDFAFVRKVAIDLAVWNLIVRRPGVMARSDLGESVNAQHDATIAWLKGLSSRARTVQLVGSAERGQSVAPSGGAETISDPLQFESFADY
jgi:phage gp36-like protein